MAEVTIPGQGSLCHDHFQVSGAIFGQSWNVSLDPGVYPWTAVRCFLQDWKFRLYYICSPDSRGHGAVCYKEHYIS